MPVAERQWRVVRLVFCANRHWGPVPGGPRYALAIAWRESGYDPWALNPSGCAGLFQHQVDYWQSRVSNMLRGPWWRRWFGAWPPSPFNARANVIVTIRMVHEAMENPYDGDPGWGAWSTAGREAA